MNIAQLLILNNFAESTIAELNREMHSIFPQIRMLYFNEGVRLWYLHVNGGQPLSFKSFGLMLAHLEGLQST